jgi:hypothetical protein
MPSGDMSAFPVLEPNLQMSFYYKLEAIRSRLLHEALQATMQQLKVPVVDKELESFVREEALRTVASFGLRGEVFFAVPCLLNKNPHLLGYYRLLLGLSQKEFYSKGPFGRFKRMEDEAQLTEGTSALLPDMCRSIIGSAELLVDGLDALSLSLVNDLQMLTLGAQLRGSENTRIGEHATQQVYDLVKSVVGSHVKEATKRTLVIQNRSGRAVVIEFASDPDVRISEKLPSGLRPRVSIEVKGGTDASNIHNRLGEAEKSHQKAKAHGFFEFWTLVRLDINEEMARQESPTTSHFFQLDRIIQADTPEGKRFREMLCSTIGIPL